MILAFEIGGSRIRAARVAKGAAPQPLGETPTPTGDFTAFAAALARFRGPQDRALALSIAGVVDPASGRATVANIACLNNRPLAADLTAALGLPVQVANDAACFALAEARQGAGRGHAGVFAIILGTGVGGGLVLDGRLLTAPGGVTGEWGHGPVIHGSLALPCGCGQTGCLDTLGGARGIERLHRHLSGQTAPAPVIVARGLAGDPAARATLDHWLALVGGQLAVLVNTLGVGVVPVGGGLANAPALIAELDRFVRGAILRPAAAPLVVPAQLGPDAGLIGAALIAADLALPTPH